MKAAPPLTRAARRSGAFGQTVSPDLIAGAPRRGPTRRKAIQVTGHYLYNARNATLGSTAAARRAGR